MSKATNGWTPERRKAQAEKIKQWKPWEQSTGARTAEGKAASSRNAYKGRGEQWAALRAEIRALHEVMKMQADMLDDL